MSIWNWLFPQVRDEKIAKAVSRDNESEEKMEKSQQEPVTVTYDKPDGLRHAAVLFALLGFSSLIAALVVVEYLNAVELLPAISDMFELPWDVTRTGSKYLYLSVAFFGIGGFLLAVSRRVESRGRPAWLPEIPTSAAVLCAIAFLSGIGAYETRSPKWIGVSWALRVDDNIRALGDDPYVYFSSENPEIVLRVRTEPGMLSIARRLSALGIPGADELGDELAVEGSKRQSIRNSLMIISVGSIFAALAIMTLFVARQRR